MNSRKKENSLKHARERRKGESPDRENSTWTSIRIINLRKVNARSSGIVCGPKAANLGQLKKMFPDHVVEGIVIPFGIFREHLDQMMPGQTVSYWEYLNNIFRQSEQMRSKVEKVTGYRIIYTGRTRKFQESSWADHIDGWFS